MENQPSPAHNRLIVFLRLFPVFLVCPLLFFTDLTRNPYYTQIALLNVLIPAWWVVWLWQAWKKKELLWVSSALDGPFFLLICVCAISWGASFFKHPHFTKPIYSEGSRAFIFLIVNAYLVYLAAIRSQDRTTFKWMLWICYVVCLVASVYGLAQYFGSEWIWPQNLNPYGSRPVSTFGNPNFMSSYLAMMIPVILADYLFRATGLPRALLFGVLMVSYSALLATLTRSSWVGMAMGLLVFAVAVVIWGPDIKRAVTRYFWIAIVSGFVITVAWPKADSGYTATVLGRLTEVSKISTGSYAPLTQRFLIWLSAWSMVQDNPALGNGWGCFELFYPFYQGPQIVKHLFQNMRTHANNAHNEILEYAAQTGIAGLGIVILLWIVFFRSSISIGRRQLHGPGGQPDPWRAIHWGLVGGVAAMLTDNLMNVSVHFAVPALLFWWWVGSVFALEPASLRLRRIDLRGVWQPAALLLCGLTLIGFMVRSFCLWREEVNFFTGFKASKAGDLPTARMYLQTAYLWHPLEVNNNYELANVYARLGEKEKAIAMYQRALDANAGYDEIYFNRATIFAQMGNIDQAIMNYRIALEINPLSHDAYNALAQLYMKDLPKYADAAEALYLQAIRAFPGDKDLWNNLGYLYTQRKQWEQAKEAYRKALEIDPNFELAKRNLEVVSRQPNLLK